MGDIEKAGSHSRRGSHIESIPYGRGRSESLTIYADDEMVDEAEAEYPAGESTGLLSGEDSGRSAIVADIKQTWSLAWPVICTFLLQMGPGICNVLFLGHLPDPEALGAGTLSTMYLNITGNTVGMGLATAMDTLCSQAYGAGDKKQVGILLQRCVAIMMVVSIPTIFLWFYAEQLLLMVGQNPKVSAMAGDFCKWSVPGLWGLFLYEPLKKYLQTQGVVKPSMYVAGIANIWCAFSNWLFMYALGWGFLGAPLARASCQWLMVFCLLAYMAWTGAGSDCWGGWSSEAFREWGTFLKLAIPGLIMTCAEFWAFEIQTLFAGYFGTEYLSAQSVIIQIIVVSGMLPMGMGVATSIRVGHYLGQEKAEAAKRAAQSGIIITIIATCITASVAVIFRHHIPYLYTSWEPAVEAAANVIPVVAAFLIFDGTQGCCSGILRGVGKQMIGAGLNAVCYYGIGLPLGYVFGFKLGHKTRGLWEGMFIALALICSTMVTLIMRFDWPEEVRRTKERLARGGIISGGH